MPASTSEVDLVNARKGEAGRHCLCLFFFGIKFVCSNKTDEDEDEDEDEKMRQSSSVSMRVDTRCWLVFLLLLSCGYLLLAGLHADVVEQGNPQDEDIESRRDEWRRLRTKI